MATNENIQHVAKRNRKNKLFHQLFFVSTCFGIVALALLLIQVLVQGLGWLDWQFLTEYASRIPQNAGIKAALVGTFYLMLITAPLTFIVGVTTAIYLEEYAKDTRFSRFIQTNIANLAGVPSIVYGLLGLTVFVRMLHLERSLLSGALTMTLLVLPIIIVASQEAIRTVPQSLRNASFALGANRWQTIVRVVLPSSLPGILTGSILSMSRAIGETAPLIVIGAVSYIAFLPRSPLDSFTVMPIQIFNWASQPQAEFQNVAAAGIIILLIMLLSMNAFAIYLRNKYQKKL
ncbi:MULTISPECIES: phosphate ABC transporter permease PstA [unclassified Paenibacillus]|uniref:phosphate ABC transporter permease PstA n=1 Tax=unclassified Paenibacillus TaxID=185978 RepID=UPI001AE92044|nr:MULTISPECIES: phosphate ABC transporter permease PstA [unclassified Paenibacillus]MBP1154624.1 phosphate transport system permease protein [Paenibacillus sp. PvP091]MBP1169992.1 phosphate transport system permease protein [Paenibacillus sp. PvR098]MBP2441020.1 phosphate transport system permease protein [Paenibacillus sp. PvP052]